jgi:hypothetical protein
MSDEGTMKGPLQAHQTASGEWWIMAPDDSDHDFRDDFEPIFEASGVGPEFEQWARLIVDVVNDHLTKI